MITEDYQKECNGDLLDVFGTVSIGIFVFYNLF